MFDIYDFDLGAPISLNERLILENSKMKIRLKHSSASNHRKGEHGMLLILVHYDFAFVSMKSKLNRFDGKRAKFLTYGETNSFEDELGTPASMAQMSNLIKYEIPGNLYEKGSSYLEAEFGLTDKFISIYEDNSYDDKMCWPINLIIEYIPPGTGANKAREDDDSESRIELITPAILDNIPISDDHNLTLRISLDTSITQAYPDIDPASSLSGTMLQQMCALEHGDGSEFDFYSINTDGVYSKTNTIFPTEYSVSDNYREVFLHYPVSQAYESSCYKLVCKKDPTIIHGTFYDVEEVSGIQTKYCFAKEIKKNSLTSSK